MFKTINKYSLQKYLFIKLEPKFYNFHTVCLSQYFQKILRISCTFILYLICFYLSLKTCHVFFTFRNKNYIFRKLHINSL